MTFRSSLSFALLFNAGAAAAVLACGSSGGDDNGTGATGAGATGGSAMAGGAGGAGGSAGKGTTTGGVGGATGGVGGGAGATGGVGGATGGVGGATGGVGGATGGVGGATGGVGGGAGATGGVGGATGGAGGAMGGTAGMPVGGTGGSGTGDCMVMPTATQSENISTVFNVSYTTDLTTVEKGQIDFGLDTTYGFTAPIDPKDMKTPLLGMKTSKSYHYKVTLSGGGKTCSSADATVMTGPLMQGLPKPTITTPGGADKLAGGFMVSEWYAGKQMAFILDKDAELVWWFDPKTVNAQFGDLTRARMSYDGKSMWIAHGNVPSQTGRMVKVNMDGSGGMDLSSSFTGMNHDFTILPDETIYFVAYSSGQCDDIKQYKGGQTTTVMNIGKAFTSGACHANAIEYSKEDDTLVVSELDHDAYVKIKRTGEVVWVLGGGSDNDFTGDAATWDNEHNLEVLGANKILMFNNGSGSGSTAIELELDTSAKTATKKWFYTASPAIANVVMGDVQRLPNGNTLVTYSTQGVIHEVDANKMLLQSLSWGTGGALGYVIKRPTLYGAPPK